MTEQPLNILIQYTKRVMKLALILAVGLSILSLFSQFYVDVKVPMIAIECEAIIGNKTTTFDTTAPNGKIYKLTGPEATTKEPAENHFKTEMWPDISAGYALPESQADTSLLSGTLFMVMKWRFSETPQGLYLGAHHDPYFNRDTDYKDLLLARRFKQMDHSYYYFSHYGDSRSLRINRKTLEVVSLASEGEKQQIKRTWIGCEEISSDKFYELVKTETDKQKSGLKF
ncbi:MAG: hypothetical protein VCB07_10560 [Gammaproteobacteria bacterium]